MRQNAMARPSPEMRWRALPRPHLRLDLPSHTIATLPGWARGKAPTVPEPRRDSLPVGALFFWGRRADARPMPRYFFILVYPDRIIGDDRGTVLPSDEAAIGAAVK